MNAEKRENDDSASSDIEGGNESSNNLTATLPKKRGRPAKTEKDKPKKEASGRGRGRPAKGAVAVANDAVADGAGSDSEPAVENGAKRAAGTAGRGRPPKAGKAKVAQPITATGKSRGRPKNAVKRAAEADDDDDADYEDRSVKKTAKSVGKRHPGRPRKAAPPSEEDDDDDVSDDDKAETEKRPVGRPTTGAVKLNIASTGRGQGRPKKAAVDSSPEVMPKKRGRPTAKPAASVQKPAGTSDDEDDDDDEDNSKDSFKNNLKADESVDEENDEDEFISADKNPTENLPTNQLAAA